MSDTLLKLFGGAILCVLLLVILRRASPDSAITAKMIAGVILAAACVATMMPIVEYICEIGESFGADVGLAESVTVLLRRSELRY